MKGRKQPMTHAYPIPTNDGRLLHNAKEAIEYVSRYCEHCTQNNTMHNCCGAQAAEAEKQTEETPAIFLIHKMPHRARWTPYSASMKCNRMNTFAGICTQQLRCLFSSLLRVNSPYMI